MATATEPTAVARTIGNTNVPQLIAQSENARQLIAPLLPRGVTLEQVSAQVRLAIARDKTGALKNCTAGSVIIAVARIVAWGLVVGETAHLVPFGNECTAVADYKGLAELVVGSGVARHVEAHVVYEHEPFRIRRGTTTEIYHDVIADPKQRGAMIGAYALFHLRYGLIAVEYMAVSEIEEIRQKHSKQWKSGALQPWYAKKTVVRRGVKLLPKNPALLERLAQLDAAEQQIDVPPALAAMGDDGEAPLVHRIGAGDDTPPPVATSGGEPYEEDGESDDAGGELPLDDPRPTARRTNALRDG